MTKPSIRFGQAFNDGLVHAVTYVNDSCGCMIGEWVWAFTLCRNSFSDVDARYGVIVDAPPTCLECIAGET